jgi:hypothetical protein
MYKKVVPFVCALLLSTAAFAQGGGGGGGGGAGGAGGAGAGSAGAGGTGAGTAGSTTRRKYWYSRRCLNRQQHDRHGEQSC